MKFQSQHLYGFDDLEYGGNLIIGYTQDRWDLTMRALKIFDGEALAKIEVKYSF